MSTTLISVMISFWREKKPNIKRQIHFLKLCLFYSEEKRAKEG